MYKRFHENVLDSFGFRNVAASSQFANNSQVNSQKLSPVPTHKAPDEPLYQSTIASKTPAQIQQASRALTPTQNIDGRPTITNVRQ